MALAAMAKRAYRAGAPKVIFAVQPREDPMRIFALAFVGVIGFALSTLAAPPPSLAPGLHVTKVAQGCGRGYHWVARHRDAYGRWVPGHCAPN